MTYFGTKIEYELEQRGVALLAADEGITADALPTSTGRLARKRATPTLTRRVKQAIAEWYVLDMQERSWGGLMAHNEQGFNIGKPPYGYLVATETHPVLAKAAEGKVKRRLVRDPLRGPVITQIYLWRTAKKLSYDQIADRLNLDPDRYPPPQPILGRGRRAIGAWTKGSVRDVLCNPKYTGHMVYNRRKNPRQDRGIPGRVNPPAEWIWSSKPTHEPLTTRALFDAGTPIGKAKKGSRPGSELNVHPATKRSYRLRSHVICDLCSRRLYGKTRRVGDGYSYYACEPVPAHHAGKDWFPTHPKSLWVREDKLLTAVRGFFTRRIFGPDRQALLAGAIDPRPAAQDPNIARIAALRAKIKDLEREQSNVVAELRAYQPSRDADIDRQWRDQLRDAFAEIATRRKTIDAQLAALTSQPETPQPSDPALLDELPVFHSALWGLPEDLERQLWADFHLQVRYHQPTRRATIRVTIESHSVHRLATTSNMIMNHLTPSPTRPGRKPAEPTGAAGDSMFSLAGSAPGGTQTCADGSPVRFGDGGLGGFDRVVDALDSRLLRDAVKYGGVDPDDFGALVNPTALAVARLAWRDGPLEGWHAVPHSRINDSEMMRATVGVTRIVRDVLIGTLPVGAEASRADDLFAPLERVLIDPLRRLPDGRTLAELAPNPAELARFHRHVRNFVGRCTNLVARFGLPNLELLLACYGAAHCWRWWLAPGWPRLVDEFIRRVEDPGQWPKSMMALAVSDHGPPPDGLGSRDLHGLLLAGPDNLSAATARYCLRAGLGALLPQDCGLPPVSRKLLPRGYFTLVDAPGSLE